VAVVVSVVAKLKSLNGRQTIGIDSVVEETGVVHDSDDRQVGKHR